MIILSVVAFLVLSVARSLWVIFTPRLMALISLPPSIKLVGWGDYENGPVSDISNRTNAYLQSLLIPPIDTKDVQSLSRLHHISVRLALF